MPITYELYENDQNMSSSLLGYVLIILSGLFCEINVNLSKCVGDKIDAKMITPITLFVSWIFRLLILVILDIQFNINLNNIILILFLAFAGIGMATLFFVMTLKLLAWVKSFFIMFNYFNFWYNFFKYYFIGRNYNYGYCFSNNCNFLYWWEITWKWIDEFYGILNRHNTVNDI